MNTVMWRIGGWFLVALLVLVTFSLGISPRLSEINANNTELLSTQRQAQLQQAALERLVVQARDKAALESRYNSLARSVPSELEVATFVNELNAMAAGSGVAVSSIKFTDPVRYQAPTQVKSNEELKAALGTFPDGSLYVFDIDMTVTGSLDKIDSFIEEVQHANRALLVYKVSITAGPAPVEYTLKIGAQAFIFNTAATTN